jgi:hypothetical protein
MSKKVVAWFSCGVTSAIACNLAIKEYGKDNVDLIYFKIDQTHPDNDRFISDCENLYGKKIEQIQGEFKTPIEVAEKKRFINGPSGARCTLELKKKLRQEIEKTRKYSAQIFGFEFSTKEILRAKRFSMEYPDINPIYPLIENKINKPNALAVLARHGIAVPRMYELGYHNNNCIGCFKGGMGYWNKIRKDFPEIFQKTLELERNLKRSCIKGLFLYELKEDQGRHDGPIVADCGIFCES